jgi:hypothetical protein
LPGPRRRLQKNESVPSLALLFVPLLLVEPLKLVAVFIAGKGHWLTGTGILIGAYAGQERYALSASSHAAIDGVPEARSPGAGHPSKRSLATTAQNTSHEEARSNYCRRQQQLSGVPVPAYSRALCWLCANYSGKLFVVVMDVKGHHQKNLRNAGIAVLKNALRVQF